MVWSEPGVTWARLVLIENAEIVLRAAVDVDAMPPIPPGHQRPIAARRDAFTIACFDRLRVLTSELKRLVAGGAPAAMRFGAAPAVTAARLASALSWIDMRVPFLSDTHLGFRPAHSPRVVRRRRGEDFCENFERPRSGEVDMVVHGGDLAYRSRVPAMLAETALAPLKRQASSGVPALLVPPESRTGPRALSVACRARGPECVQSATRRRARARRRMGRTASTTPSPSSARSLPSRRLFKLPPNSSEGP